MQEHDPANPALRGRSETPKSDPGGSISNPDKSAPDNSTRSFLQHVARRAALPWLIAGILLLIAAIVIGSEIDRHLSAIEAWLTGLGRWGLLAYIVLFVLATSCLVPDSLLCVVGGALFGMEWGIITATVGMFLSSVLQFTLAHRLLRPRIERMLAKRPALDAIQRAVRRDELRLQVLLRLTPLNPATASYVFGAVGVRFRGFLIACLALIPALTIEVYAGHAGRRIAGLAGAGAPASRLHEFTLISGLAVCAVVFVIISRLARNAVAKAVAKTETAGSGAPAGREGREQSADSQI